MHGPQDYPQGCPPNGELSNRAGPPSGAGCALPLLPLPALALGAEARPARAADWPLAPAGPHRIWWGTPGARAREPAHIRTT